MPNIILTREELISHKPCADGLDWFDAMVGLQGRKKSLLIRGTTALLWLYSNHESRPYASWARDRGLIPPLFAPKADLRGVYLQGVYLSWTNLYGADLQCAYLSGTDLYRADLSWANLAGADLSHATLAGADLSHATLAGTNLSEAIRWEDDPPVPGWKLVRGRLQKDRG